ncbi:hypothetical protein NPX13_g10848 [Xylaria arbuscula]|uniref:Amidohydrolase-related domain-containing protein n=1 Tax=Xylaria arbuscula TaxID=114810 RepID=A0A9W8THK6_9PEZI|nr:hypothetical protein NPX13_g10848 [Xylaria arbuscula]
MATVNAARVAGYEDELGSLSAGKLADIVIFSGESESESSQSSHSREPGGSTKKRRDPYEQAIFAPQKSIELVLRGGKILLASLRLKDLTTTTTTTTTTGFCEDVAFGNANSKIVCVTDELGMSFGDLEASLGGVYPAVLPEIPPYEPSCRTDTYIPTS